MFSRMLWASCSSLKMSPRLFRMSIWSEIEMGCLLYLIALYIKKRPALVRCSSGSVAGSIGAKVLLFSEMVKQFEGKCRFKTHFYIFFAFFALKLKRKPPRRPLQRSKRGGTLIGTGVWGYSFSNGSKCILGGVGLPSRLIQPMAFK